MGNGFLKARIRKPEYADTLPAGRQGHRREKNLTELFFIWDEKETVSILRRGHCPD